MSLSTPHIMTLIEVHEGTEVWLCPICGRRFLIEWDPWRKVVLELGDSTAQHSGGKGLIVGRMDVEQ